MAFFSQYRGRRAGFRWVAAALSFCLAIPYLSVVSQAYGESPAYSAGMLCPHHQAHDEACGYAEAQPEQPCGHVHDESCGGMDPESPLPDEGQMEPAPASDEGAGAEEPEAPGCTHIHDEACGYMAAVEAAPCAFFCEICGAASAPAAVTGWSWESEVLEFLEDAKLWGLGLPGANAGNPVTAEALAEFLPQEVTAALADGTETALPLAWDYSALPEEGDFEGSVILKAALPEGYALAEGVPELAVLLEIGGGESYAETADKMKFLNKWYFISRDGSEMETNALIAVMPDLASKTPDEIIQWLKDSVLPNKLGGWVPNDSASDIRLPTIGFVQDTKKTDDFYETTETGDKKYEQAAQWGSVVIDGWKNFPASFQDGDKFTVVAYTTPKIKDNRTYRLFVNSNDPADYVHKGSDGFPDQADTRTNEGILSLTVTIQDINLSNYTVPAANPENVTVNLFDYWVADYGEAPASPQGDILKKSDFHAHEILDTGEVTDDPSPYSTKEDWNLGINKGHLLLFGDGLIHAGLWNKGAGENTRYGKRYAGMEQIVKNTLNADGYPEINLANAEKILTDEKDSLTTDPQYGIPKYELIKDYRLAGDHNASHGTDYNSDNIQNLSSTVIDLWEAATHQTLENGSESLDYLFSLQDSSFKKHYENVTGLFQLDNDGYYYYNMRENFAEFQERTQTDKNGQPSDGRFVLYNAPATTRTDGQKSIGNFFPFNKGAEVFTGLKEDDTLSSSVDCANNEMNHHLGMTVEVDFRQPANGQINTGSNAKPMTFEFSGDDDVWVFIDDVLVLDIGGVHSELYGTIDFHTGDVYIGRAFDTKGIPENPADPKNMVTHTTLKALYETAGMEDTTQWNGNTFASNTVHTLKMFYLERGNYDSSIALRFNLQPMLPQRIVKIDQNGQPLKGVEFELYEAAEADSGISCLYTDGVRESETFYVQQTKEDALVTLKTDENGTAMFLTEEGGYFNFADRGDAYYILKETIAPAGYRKQPVDIVLYYDQKTAMLSVANRWTTGAYACSVSNITAFSHLNYGQVVGGEVTEGNEKVPSDEQKNGLIVAVPLLEKRSNNAWLALSGSNLTGFQSQEFTKSSNEATWKSAVLEAVLEQAKSSDNAPWRLTWNEDNNRLEGILYDLPGLATRYKLISGDKGDMHMVYGIISADALKDADVTGTTAAERYESLGKVPEDKVQALLDGFCFLSIDQFNRDFRSMIYIPNERRELWVRKVDQDGQPLSDAEFGLFTDYGCTNQKASGVTGKDGMLIFSPNPPTDDNGKILAGYAKMEWASSTNTRYYLKEITPPSGHKLNSAITPIIVGIYSIYADAGDDTNGVSVLAGAGRLTQTMRQYAMDNNVDITLQDITAFMQTQESGQFKLDGWQDTKLEGTNTVRSMNLHFGKNAEVDYGLHDEDGGKNFKPFFTTDTGFIRARIKQNWAALNGGQYEGTKTDVNKDNLGETDLTNLFSLLNIVVVTDRADPEPEPGTGKLTISKKLTGTGYGEEEYTKRFAFTIRLTDANGVPLADNFDYYFYGEDKAGTLKNGDTLFLHHDEAVTILGLPVGTRYTVTEEPVDNWHVIPESGEYTGSIDEKDKTYVAAFTNSTTPPPKGNLTIQKTVSGDNLTGQDRAVEFTFTLLLKDGEGAPLAGTYPYTGSKSGNIGTGGIITLSHGQSVTITGLPEGTQYTVTEAQADGWEAVQDQTGVIVKDMEAEAAFVNSKTPSTDPGDPTGSLTIKKTVSGDNLTGQDRAVEFTFTLLLKDGEGNPLAGTYPYTGSKSGNIGNGGTIALSHGQSVTITGLPKGTQYTVTEAQADGWKTAQDQAGVIVKDAEAAFVNTKTVPDKPVDPDDPKPDPPKDPDPDPKPDPKDPETPPEEPKDPENPENPGTPEEPEHPEHPVNPGYPTELPDPNDPDSPDEITIWEDDVPRTYIKIWDPEEEEYFYVPEDEIPLAPPTGQKFLGALWVALAVITMAGAAVPVSRKIAIGGKREE